MAAAYDLCIKLTTHQHSFKLKIEKPPNWKKMSKEEQQEKWGIFVEMPVDSPGRSRAKIEEKSLRTIQRSTTIVFVIEDETREATVQQLDVDPRSFMDKVLMTYLLTAPHFCSAKTQKDLDEALVT
jgi:hypothetical protein